MMDESNPKKRSFPIGRILLPILILALGIGGMRLLERMKKPPAEATVSEPSIPVAAWTARVSDYPTFLTGFGVVRVVHETRIAPEVSGRVTEISPRLQAGEVFKEGEIFFKLDPRDYEAMVADAEARVQQFQQTRKRLEMQLDLNRKRLPRIERIRDLAKKEFDRVTTLYEKDKVGTQSGVEQAERLYDQAADQYAILENQTDLLPHQIEETKAALAAEEAQASRARLNRDRCSVTAPFRGRIRQTAVNRGDVVSPAMPVLTLADDSALEIRLPIDSVNAQKLLRFETDNTSENHWFAKPSPVACEIRWTEAPDQQVWTGHLVRVEGLSPDTRSLNLAVRITEKEAHAVASAPLAEGMFCSVRIPGRMLQQVVRLPREAVTLDSQIHLDIKGRLKSLPVQVDWFDKTYAYVSHGPTNGDLIVVTRLIAPIDNTLLKSTVMPSEPQKQ
jgi:multidrug efflux pump subunit AcrA (membrane-fusion protein)